MGIQWTRSRSSFCGKSCNLFLILCTLKRQNVVCLLSWLNGNITNSCWRADDCGSTAPPSEVSAWRNIVADSHHNAWTELVAHRCSRNTTFYPGLAPSFRTFRRPLSFRSNKSRRYHIVLVEIAGPGYRRLQSCNSLYTQPDSRWKCVRRIRINRSVRAWPPLT